MTKTTPFILITNKSLKNISVWNGVKVIHETALHKYNIVLLRFRLRNYYTTIFPFDLTYLRNSQAGCFPESYPSSLLSLQPLNSQLKVIHFTLHFVARFQVERKIPKTHSSLGHRNKFFNIIETYYSNSSLRSS